MSTFWWIVVLWLACSFSCLIGYIARVQVELFHQQVYDVDFTRKRVGS